MARPTGNSLRATIKAAWEVVPVDYLEKLCESMPRRVQVYINANGGYIGY